MQLLLESVSLGELLRNTVELFEDVVWRTVAHVEAGAAR